MSVAQPSVAARAVSGAAWISIEMLGSQLASFVVFVWLSRYLTPIEFGVIGVAFMALQCVQGMLLNNLTVLLARHAAPSDTEFDTVFWLCCLAGSMCWAGAWSVVAAVRPWFNQPALFDALSAMSSVCLLYSVTRTHETWFIRFFHFKTLAIRGIVASVLSGIVGVCLAAHGYGVVSIVIQQIVLLTVSFLLMYHRCPWRPQLRFCSRFARHTLHFNGQLLPSGVANHLSQHLDAMLVSALFGLTMMGYYSVAKRIRLAAQLVFFTPLKGIVLSSLAELQADRQRLTAAFIKGLVIVLALMCPLFGALAIMAQPLITQLFGPNWLPSATLLQYLAIAGLCSTLIVYLENLFVIENRPRLHLISALGYAVGVCLALLVLPTSIEAIGLAFVLPYVVIFPCVLVVSCRLLALTIAPLIRTVFTIMCAAALSVLVVAWLLHLTLFLALWLHLTLAVLCLPFFYLILLQSLSPSTVAMLRDTLQPLFEAKILRIKNN